MRDSVRPLTILTAIGVGLFLGCGEPDLPDSADDAEGSPLPIAETGSPAPGLPPDPSS